jgi:EmrB/QacA subfamily drug resistance transporter
LRLDLDSQWVPSVLVSNTVPYSCLYRTCPKKFSLDIDQEKTSSPSPEAADNLEGFKPDAYFYAAFGTLSVITLVAALDATSLAVAIPVSIEVPFLRYELTYDSQIVAQKLNGTAIEAFWSGTGFLLAATVLQPIFASLSNFFGRKNLALAAMVFFTLGAIIAGVAKNFSMLIAGRAVQGIGGGGIIVITEIIATDMVPLRERGKWFGFISSMWAVGSVLGPVIGGAFSQNVTWRWIFYINLPFCGIAFVAIPLFIRLTQRKSSIAEKLRRIDWIGIALFIASATSFLIPISWGGVIYEWNSWHTIVPLVLGACGLVAFGFYEHYGAKEPMINTVIFNNRTTTLTYFTTFFHGMLLWCLLYFLPLYFEAVKSYSPVLAGVACFPLSFTVAPVSVVVGFVASITGQYWWALVLGWVLTTAGSGLLYLLHVDTSVAGWIFITLVVGIGMGMLFPSMGFSIQASAPSKHMAISVAMFSFFRLFGQTVGVAIGGVIFQNEMKKKLLAYPDLASKAVEYSQDAASLVQLIKAMPASSQKSELQQAYVNSLQVVWLVCCGFSGLCLIAVLFTKRYSMDRDLETEQSYKKRDQKATVKTSA